MESAKETWAKRVRQWQRSGMTAAQFAAANGLNAGTLSHWKWRLNKGARSDASSAASDATFVELTPSPSTWWHAADRIEISIGGKIVVRVPNDFDAETLRRVLTVIEQVEGAQ